MSKYLSTFHNFITRLTINCQSQQILIIFHKPCNRFSIQDLCHSYQCQPSSPRASRKITLQSAHGQLLWSTAAELPLFPTAVIACCVRVLIYAVPARGNGWNKQQYILYYFVYISDIDATFFMLFFLSPITWSLLCMCGNGGGREI